MITKAENPIEAAIAMTPPIIEDPTVSPQVLDKNDTLFYKRSDFPVKKSRKSTMDDTLGYTTTSPRGLKLGGLVPVKTGKISLLGAHLIFGGCSKIHFSAVLRASLVCTALLGEIALFGLGLLYFEGDDVFSTYSPNLPQPDFEMDRDAYLAAISVSIQLLISMLLVFLYSRFSIVATFVNILLIFTYLGGIVGMSMLYTKYYSMIWLAGSGVAAMIEILLAQTVLMALVYCSKR